MSNTSTNPPSSNITQQFVLNKCDYFASTQLWPIASQINPARWFDNFSSAELEHAVHLLHSFHYFDEILMDRIFAAGIQTLSRLVTPTGEPFPMRQAAWQAFVDSLIVTYVTGEKPNPTDSGYLFARKARQIVGFNEDQIMDPADALSALINSPSRPVLFVDDFVGSGSQFLHTWGRPLPVLSSGPSSFQKVSLSLPCKFYYCPAFCTENGARTLRVACPKVVLNPGHIISSRYSALAPDSLVWPPHLETTAEDFLFTASQRAGIPDTGGNDVNDWRGFGRLGLTFAFHGSIPDATLPIFYWEKNGWHPLMRRT